jgi:hypothetical protein
VRERLRARFPARENLSEWRPRAVPVCLPQLARAVRGLLVGAIMPILRLSGRETPRRHSRKRTGKRVASVTDTQST